MSVVSDRAETSLTDAKAALIDTARAIDPLAPMRRRPFISVSVAAGMGALLGMNLGRSSAAGELKNAISIRMRPAALAIGKYLLAGVSQAATECVKSGRERRLRRRNSYHKEP